MRRITRYLLWLFIFSVPWGVVSSFQGLGTITRLLGLVTIAAGILTTTAETRIRKPGIIFWFALLFVISSILSLFWTISYPYSAEQARTYIQFVGLIWVVREFSRTREEQHSLLLAFCLGALVFAFDVLRNFVAGDTLPGDVRYSASDTSPNYVGFALVIGFPMAWYLFLNHRGTVRVVTALYCLVAPVAILLTAGRGAFLAGIVALSVIPLTLRRESFGFRALVVVFVAAVTIGVVVPEQSWDRMLTVRPEIESGTVGGRGEIWDVGWRLFEERPVLGVGTGAFPLAVQPVFNSPTAAHNMPLALLVEQGIIGLCLFAGLLGACAWIVIRLPSPERKLWAPLLATLLVFGLTGDSHTDKITWVLFGLLAATDTVKTTKRRSWEPTLLRAKVEPDTRALVPNTSPSDWLN